MRRAMYRSAIEVLYQWKTWNDRDTSGVDFPFVMGYGVAPLEVMVEIDPQGKRLKVFADRFYLAALIRSSLSDRRREGRFLNFPLHAIGNIASGAARLSETFPE
jgi:hypothetical protein